MITFPLKETVNNAISVPEGWVVSCRRSESDAALELFAFDGKRKTLLDGKTHIFTFFDKNKHIAVSTPQGYFLYKDQQIVRSPQSEWNNLERHRAVQQENFQLQILRPTEDPLSLAVSKLADAPHGFLIANVKQSQWKVIATQTPPLRCFLAEDDQTICLVEKDMLTIMDNPFKIY